MTTFHAIKARVRAGGRKPSPAQQRVLEAMRDGRIIHWMSGLHPGAFLSGGGQKTVSTATVLAMERAGWIESNGENFTGRSYQLTTLGRAALTPEP